MGIYPILTQFFKNQRAEGIPCAFFEEGASDQDLRTTIHVTKQSIQSSDLYRAAAPEINSFYKEAQGVKYLPLHHYGAITALLKPQMSKIFGFLPKEKYAEVLPQLVLELYREAAYRQELELYAVFNSLNISFANIDAKTRIYHERIMAVARDHGALVDNESIRIQTMTTNLLAETDKFLPEGGIAVVSTGRIHAHRLAANVRLATSKQDDVAVHAFEYRSPFSDHWTVNDDLVTAADDTSRVDSIAIRQIYQTLPYQALDFNESPLERLQTALQTPAASQTISDRERGATFSLFPPPAHDRWMAEVRKLKSQFPEVLTDEFIHKLDSGKNYGLALRNFCSWGNVPLIRGLLKYSNVLPIDFHGQSTNKNTALDWLKKSSAGAEDIREISLELEVKMRRSSFKPN